MTPATVQHAGSNEPPCNVNAAIGEPYCRTAAVGCTILFGAGACAMNRPPDRPRTPHPTNVRMEPLPTWVWDLLRDMMRYEDAHDRGVHCLMPWIDKHVPPLVWETVITVDIILTSKDL